MHMHELSLHWHFSMQVPHGALLVHLHDKQQLTIGGAATTGSPLLVLTLFGDTFGMSTTAFAFGTSVQTTGTTHYALKGGITHGTAGVRIVFRTSESI